MIAQMARATGVILILLFFVFGLITGGGVAYAPGFPAAKLETYEQYYYRTLPQHLQIIGDSIKNLKKKKHGRN